MKLLTIIRSLCVVALIGSTNVDITATPIKNTFEANVTEDDDLVDPGRLPTSRSWWDIIFGL